MFNNEKTLNIDIPVKLKEVRLVFSVSKLAFEGDLPASLFHMRLIKNDVRGWNAKDDIVAVFHANAGHVTLNDDAYNVDRNIVTGNPYKTLVTDLMQEGVRIELCGATAAAHKWGHADLLPGVRSTPMQWRAPRSSFRKASLRSLSKLDIGSWGRLRAASAAQR